tara:strand:- start:257 stop:736 length:480 start_codon:yes stop_codon:yes gene_type:complete
MASTISASTLTVTISENITLNGTQQGATNTATITGIGEIQKRILTITTNEATIATMSGAVASAGHFNDSAVRYMRFTNKDNTNHVTLTFRNQDNDEFAIKVDAGNSFMIFSDNDGGMVGMFNATQDADAASDTALGSITNIQADAGASTVDIEMLVAST